MTQPAQPGPSLLSLYTRCPSCGLVATPSSADAPLRPDGGIDWAHGVRLRCGLCGHAHTVHEADLLPRTHSYRCVRTQPSECTATSPVPAEVDEAVCAVCGLHNPNPAARVVAGTHAAELRDRWLAVRPPNFPTASSAGPSSVPRSEPPSASPTAPSNRAAPVPAARLDAPAARHQRRLPEPVTDWYRPTAAVTPVAHLLAAAQPDLAAGRSRCASTTARVWQPLTAPELATLDRCPDCTALADGDADRAWQPDALATAYTAALAPAAAGLRRQYAARVAAFLAWCALTGCDPRGHATAATETLAAYTAHLAAIGAPATAQTQARKAILRLHLITGTIETAPTSTAPARPPQLETDSPWSVLGAPPASPAADRAPAMAPPASPAVRSSAALRRRRIAVAVGLLGLGRPDPEDPQDRYHPAVLTARWLEELSASSERSYFRALASWLGWCQAHGLDWWDARPVDVGGWRDQLTVRPTGVRGPYAGPGIDPARATLTKSVVVVSSWYRFLAGSGVAVANPAAAVRRPTPANISSTPALTATELTEWLDALLARARREGTETAWRDAAHQFLLWDTGLRVTASCMAQFADLRLATRIVDGAPVEYAVLRYRKKSRGRGADWGEVVITPDTLAVLRSYWVVRAARERVLPERLSGPLLVSTPHAHHPGGRPLDQRQVWQRMRLLAGQLGMRFASRAHPHLARATWATVAYLAGVDSIRIRDGLGHSSVAVTERYIRAILSTQDNPGWTVADVRARSHATTAA